MRKHASAALMLIALGATSAYAGRLFGDVKIAGKPAPENTLITIQAAPKDPKDPKEAPAPIDSVKCDKVGSYKVMAKNEGKYTLTVFVDKKTAKLEVFSFKEPTRYDLLVEEKDGKLTVRRK
jgi:hypothetical protein